MTDLDLSQIDCLDLEDIESDTTNSCYNFPCKHLREDDESNYPPGTEEYKRARKRRQNRESAVRIRARKKIEECHIFGNLDVLKESTGKLKVENAQLRSQNEVLKEQIEMLKKLASPEKVKIGVKGKRAAKFGLMAAVVCLALVGNYEESQPVNSGGRSLVSLNDGFGLRPVLLMILTVLIGSLGLIIWL